MTLNDTDRIVDEIANNKKKIQIIKFAFGEFYGCVEFKQIPIYYTQIHTNVEMVLIDCRQWISDNMPD
ncbi:hypothetical protein UFOVP1230_19 [uncultured Caudovirales phage]|uniref:Uncharacterized protein n=1 Tax=uncultured Caudovirales phage TaxID=2100421 RepID=A0A6J5R4Z8_9CAUD|nr:hypothetical protein UFOVP1230_19 [uncultured Caudovirales phage]|tara:strand:+ start:2317 stop:2520 length:204 start_codon:yes stop_codon:yes gene_type:complete